MAITATIAIGTRRAKSIASPCAAFDHVNDLMPPGTVTLRSEKRTMRVVTRSEVPVNHPAARKATLISAKARSTRAGTATEAATSRTAVLSKRWPR